MIINTRKAIYKIYIFIFILFCLAGCSQKPNKEVQGYIEANLTYVSTSEPGKLVKLAVKRGDHIKSGQLLFQLEKEPYSYQEASARSLFAKAQAHYENNLTGKRLPYIKQIESEIKKSQAQYDLDQINYLRNKDLYNQHAVSLQDLQRSKSNRDKSLAQISALEHKLSSIKLPARIKLIESSKESAISAKNKLQLLKWKLNQLTVKAPVSGIVFDNYYWKGEQVRSFMPVVSILVPEQIKLVFFVTESELSKIKIDENIKFKIDGVKTLYDAKISFISNIAEYTSPIIYSEQSRKDLVYKIESKINLSSSQKWHPGQPVSIILPKISKISKISIGK